MQQKARRNLHPCRKYLLCLRPNEAICYDIKTKKAHRAPHNLILASAGLCMYMETAYLIGGAATFDDCDTFIKILMRDGAIVDIQQLESIKPARSFPAAATIDGKRILSIGGYGKNTHSGASERLTLCNIYEDSKGWMKGGDLKYARSGATACVFQGTYVYCFGGVSHETDDPIEVINMKEDFPEWKSVVCFQRGWLAIESGYYNYRYASCAVSNSEIALVGVGGMYIYEPGTKRIQKKVAIENHTAATSHCLVEANGWLYYAYESMFAAYDWRAGKLTLELKPEDLF